MMKITIVAAACVLALLPRAALGNQMGWGRADEVNALGISFDYARTKDRNDAGLYAAYRYGMAHIVSLYFSADAGYRFCPGSVRARAGGQIMFLFVGLEAGILCAYRVRKERAEWHDRARPPGPWAPAAYVGLACTAPFKRMVLALSLGGNFYFVNHDHEFYLMASCLFNFKGR
ncbi:MAG: hypothetical protein JW838_08535 [Spirochaetes bacterium]|nr:hypothetical protein [Spirochaetota bacterium]